MKLLVFSAVVKVLGEGAVASPVVRVSDKGKGTNFKIAFFFGSFKISIFNFFLQI